jgi:hypothetical protein
MPYTQEFLLQASLQNTAEDTAPNSMRSTASHAGSQSKALFTRTF